MSDHIYDSYKTAMSCFSDKGHDMTRYNLKMKVLTFAKVVRGGPLNGTFLSSILILKSPDLFWKSPENFVKVKIKNEK